MASNDFQSRTDTQLADLYGQSLAALRNIESAYRDLAFRLGYSIRTREPLPKRSDLLAEAAGSDRYGVDTAVRTIEEQTQVLASIREQQAPLEALYEQHKWSRFFLVNNTGGHIHSSMHCSTCFIDTDFSWLPTLSGLTEAEAVEEHGSILCSVCFPSAPVEWTNGTSKREQADKDARAAERAERQAAKDAKAITCADGSVLLDGNGWEIKTLVTARKELTDSMIQVIDWKANTNDNAAEMLRRHEDAVERIIAAIAAKTGEDAEATRAEHTAKAEKKQAKQAKEAAKWAEQMGFNR